MTTKNHKNGHNRDELPTLAEVQTRRLERSRIDREFIFKAFPHLYDEILLLPVPLNILMVTDGSLNFGNGGFGLSTLVGALEEGLGVHAWPNITTAHRRADSAANISNFRFDQTYFGHALSYYDELWMFGFERDDSQQISNSELETIIQFMDSGKGVFATGDHVNMGKSMCGRIPRVRSMRRWQYDPADVPAFTFSAPPGDPVNPGDPADVVYRMRYRHDTLRQGHDGSGNAFQFDDQSDDVPQPLQLNWNYLPSTNIFFQRRYPHPLLCSTTGPIEVLPDHPHEGWCEAPSNLSGTYSSGNVVKNEYPELTPGAGDHFSPELVAWGTVLGGHTTDEVGIGSAGIKPPVVAATFGVIAAYDGHRLPSPTNPGRVSVDSTWHHFVNVNLVGSPNNPVVAKRQGFQATAEGQAHFEKIKAYYRNIAVWLAPKNKQHRMFQRVLWAARYDYPIAEEFAGLSSRKAIAGLRPSELLDLGAISRKALYRYAPPCTVLHWLRLVLEEFYPKRIPPWDVWFPRPRPEPDPGPLFDPETEVLTILGSIMSGIVAEFPNRDLDDRDKAGEVLEKVLAEGAQRGVRAAWQHYRESAEQLLRFTEAERELGLEQGHGQIVLK